MNHYRHDAHDSQDSQDSQNDQDDRNSQDHQNNRHNKHNRHNLWSDIKHIAQTQKGRQAMMTTGAVIAAWHFGTTGPELFSVMHDATALYVTKYPFMDPAVISASLWDGARYFAASALDYGVDMAANIGIEISRNTRETLVSARDFISHGTERGLEHARTFLETTADYVGGVTSDALSITVEIGTPIVETVKTWGAPVIAIIFAAKEAYDYFDIGKSICNKLFRRGKKEIEDAGAKKTEDINFSMNVAIAGHDVLVAADDELTRRKAAAKILDVPLDKIIHVSKQLHDNLEVNGRNMSDNDMKMSNNDIFEQNSVLHRNSATHPVVIRTRAGHDMEISPDPSRHPHIYSDNLGKPCIRLDPVRHSDMLRNDRDNPHSRGGSVDISGSFLQRPAFSGKAVSQRMIEFVKGQTGECSDKPWNTSTDLIRHLTGQQARKTPDTEFVFDPALAEQNSFPKHALGHGMFISGKALVAEHMTSPEMS